MEKICPVFKGRCIKTECLAFSWKLGAPMNLQLFPMCSLLRCQVGDPRWYKEAVQAYLNYLRELQAKGTLKDEYVPQLKQLTVVEQTENWTSLSEGKTGGKQ